MDLKLDANSLSGDLREALLYLFRDASTQNLVDVLVETDRGTSVRIVPRDPSRAPFTAYAEDHSALIYLTIAMNTNLEVPLRGGRYTTLRGTREFLAIVQGIVSKGFEETIWSTKDGRIVASVGTLHVEERPFRVREGSLRAIFGLGQKKTVRYLPYWSDIVKSIQQKLALL